MTSVHMDAEKPSRAGERKAWGGVLGFASWRRVAVEVCWALAAAAIALAIGFVALGVSPTDLGSRWLVGGADQVLHYGLFSSAIDTFPFFPNAHLGFPTAQNLFFAPLFDFWSAGFVWLVSGLVPNGIWALNLYNVASFAAVGFTSYVFFRALRVRRAVALLFGVLFAVVPYHFYQIALGHPFLSNYWAVPLAGILVLMVAGDRTNPFAGWIGRAQTRSMRRARRIVPIVVLGFAVAFTQSYYFVFAALLVGGIWLVTVVTSLIRRRRLRELLWPTITAGTLLALIGVQLAVLSLNFGNRYATYFGVRTFSDSELYGGKFIDLILPSLESGFSRLVLFSRGYYDKTAVLTGSEASSTALVASAAIIFCFGLVMVRVFTRPHAGDRPPSAFARFVNDERVAVLLTAFLGAFLFFIVSGLGTVLAFAVSPEIRAWSRMSIVISMFALAVAAVLIDSLVKKTWVLAIVIVVVAGIAGIDQVPRIAESLPLSPTSDAALEQFTADAESLLPAGCGVVELPLKGFPETGNIGAMGDYDEALPYIYAHDDDLKWSYGSVLGTEDADFWAAVSTPAQFAEAVDSSKACAVLVDTYAYSSDPGGWTPWVTAAGFDPLSPRIVSSDADRRYLLFSSEK